MIFAGQLPFEGADKPAIKAAILRGQMKPLPHNLRPECASFISCMLARDPRDRLSAHDLIQHPYIKLYCQAVRTPSGSIPAYRKSMSRQGSADPASAILPVVAELKGTSSTASQITQALPLSFSLRHNELADTTIPEKMVLKVGFVLQMDAALHLHASPCCLKAVKQSCLLRPSLSSFAPQI